MAGDLEVDLLKVDMNWLSWLCSAKLAYGPVVGLMEMRSRAGA